jgi:hypothetical protein
MMVRRGAGGGRGGEVGRAAGAGGAAVAVGSAVEGSEAAADVTGGKGGGAGCRRGRRAVRAFGAVLGVVVMVVSNAAMGLVGLLLWTYPLPFSVSLPEGVEKGEILTLSPPTDAVSVSQNSLTVAFGDLRSEKHQWVGEIYLARQGSSRQVIAFHLGQSIYVDGLGTLTLTSVSPDMVPPWQRPLPGSGPRITFNLNPDPGVTTGPRPHHGTGSPTPGTEPDLEPDQEENG